MAVAIAAVPADVDAGAPAATGSQGYQGHGTKAAMPHTQMAEAEAAAAQQPPSPSSAKADTGPCFTGWMSKRGAINTAWRRRYFVLSGDNRLAYFKTDKQAASGRPQGVVDLNCLVRVLSGDEANRVCRWPEDVASGRRLALELEQRTYALYADTEEETLGWVQAIGELCDDAVVTDGQPTSELGAINTVYHSPADLDTTGTLPTPLASASVSLSSFDGTATAQTSPGESTSRDAPHGVLADLSGDSQPLASGEDAEFHDVETHADQEHTDDDGDAVPIHNVAHWAAHVSHRVLMRWKSLSQAGWASLGAKFNCIPSSSVLRPFIEQQLQQGELSESRAVLDVTVAFRSSCEAWGQTVDDMEARARVAEHDSRPAEFARQLAQLRAVAALTHQQTDEETTRLLDEKAWSLVDERQALDRENRVAAKQLQLDTFREQLERDVSDQHGRYINDTEAVIGDHLKKHCERCDASFGMFLAGNSCPDCPAFTCSACTELHRRVTHRRTNRSGLERPSLFFNGGTWMRTSAPLVIPRAEEDTRRCSVHVKISNPTACRIGVTVTGGDTLAASPTSFSLEPHSEQALVVHTCGDSVPPPDHVSNVTLHALVIGDNNAEPASTPEDPRTREYNLRFVVQGPSRAVEQGVGNAANAAVADEPEETAQPDSLLGRVSAQQVLGLAMALVFAVLAVLGSPGTTLFALAGVLVVLALSDAPTWTYPAVIAIFFAVQGGTTQ
eukprot:m.489250 g.489250  ORF g.489250 m.489250 type:complete len:729 (-) comp26522_c0_seq1:137-2323(-)